ncbi:MAG TPA: SRPBCC domain-containing protein [Rugosimonospora sp.]|jgi:uncharacterized protein YndB with AHSA1/START domain
MTSQPASMRLPAPPDQVHAILVDPLALPQWNEAFLSISGPPRPVPGLRYRLTVRPGLPGHWEYTAIQPDRVEAVWGMPGFHEQATWTLRPQDGGTLVTHDFQHTGWLASVLSNAYRGVEDLRLRRLERRLLAVYGE